MTASAFHVRLTRSVRGVAVRDGIPDAVAPGSSVQGETPLDTRNEHADTPVDPTQNLADLECQQLQLEQTQDALNDVVQKLMQLQEDMLVTHRREIASLAVEIARRVLMQEVQDGDYQIEQIIQEALKNAPTQQEVVVHLHPEDLQACQVLQQENPEKPLARLTLVGDTAVGRAECLLETPKGVVKSFIENHLDTIREALERANGVSDPG